MRNSKIEITRVVPSKQSVTVDYVSYCNIDKITCKIYDCNGVILKQHTKRVSRTGSLNITELDCNTDYSIALYTTNNHTKPLSKRRLFRTGEYPGVIVNYIHPEDSAYDSSGRYPASPHIIKLENGALLVSHDIFIQKGGQNLTKIFRSDNNGESWSFVNNLTPCFWGGMFLHEKSLYMLCAETEEGSILLYRSVDNGESWSEPVVIVHKDKCKNIKGHKAPVPFVTFKNRIWTAVEYGAWGKRGHDSAVLSVPCDADLMKPENWTSTVPLKYNPNWQGAIKGGKPDFIEGNVVITPDRKLVNILRYNTVGGTPDYGKAIVLSIDTDQPSSQQTFEKIINFHGNMSKFYILYDDLSKKYWALVNRVTTQNVKQRNILTLVSSEDLSKWTIVKDVINYQDNSWYEDDTKTGFQYPSLIFDGNDIKFLSRTAINGAHSFHDSNCITYHTIKNFRKVNRKKICIF